MNKYKWTKELDENLLKSKNVSEFIRKYKVDSLCYKTALKRKKELLGIKVKKTTKKIKEEKPKKIKEEKIIDKKNIKELENIGKIILDVPKLLKEGVNFYTTNSRSEISKYDKILSDFRHVLENTFDSMDEKELIKIAKDIGIVSRQRRLYKNEVEFLNVNKNECNSFINFLNSAEQFSKNIDNRIYNTRVLKEEFGKTLITSENNSKIAELKKLNLELEEEVKELKKQPIQQQLTNDALERLYNLEQYNLKEARRKKREKGEKVSIDYLKPNWRDLFQKELDPITKNGVINDCYAKYTGLNIKKIRDLDVWERILPDYLYEKKWFLKNEK